MKFSYKPKIVLVPYPAQGHVTPMLQLALSLQTHGFDPIMVTPEFIHTRIEEQSESMDGISFLSIPDGLDVNEPRDFFTLSFAMENNMPSHFETILRSLDGDEGAVAGGGVVCVVVDLLASWAIQVANRCKLPVAGFWPAMLATYNLIKAIPDMIHLGFISECGIPQHQDTMCSLPGQPLLRAKDLPWLIGNISQRKARFRFWLQTLNRSKLLQWLLLNSFEEESDVNLTIQSLPKVYALAPFVNKSIKKVSFWEEDKSCLSWLDDQKQDSVIYVSFGSWVSPIEEEKVTEMALGLEATKRPFIWVLGPKWREGLPIGYLERVSGYAKVVSWAPQRQVLQHKAVGCYITHCGWNSTMEAIECGKKLLCYPIAGDQFVNCAYIVKVWKIGVKMNGMGRDDVVRGVRRVVTEGKELELRMKKLKGRISDSKDNLGKRNDLTAFVEALTKSIIGYHNQVLNNRII
ncbi:hypothetical protein ACHQM5_027714 [Ranunculus cassubicifolius]